MPHTSPMSWKLILLVMIMSMICNFSTILKMNKFIFSSKSLSNKKQMKWSW